MSGRAFVAVPPSAGPLPARASGFVMKPEHIKKLARVYSERLSNLGYNEIKADIADKTLDKSALLNHVCWMCYELRYVHKDRDKMMRWLCFIQGVFAAHGVYSINELRWHNAPNKLKEEIQERMGELESQRDRIDFEIRELEHIWVSESE
jgi:hypothetical protein